MLKRVGNIIVVWFKSTNGPCHHHRSVIIKIWVTVRDRELSDLNVAQTLTYTNMNMKSVSVCLSACVLHVIGLYVIVTHTHVTSQRTALLPQFSPLFPANAIVSVFHSCLRLVLMGERSQFCCHVSSALFHFFSASLWLLCPSIQNDWSSKLLWHLLLWPTDNKLFIWFSTIYHCRQLC